MRGLLICAGAVALFGSAALADEVIIAPVPGIAIENRATDETTTKTIRQDADGCTTKSVTRTNEETGSSVTKEKSSC